MAGADYLGLGACYGPRLRQVADLPDRTWVALLGWEGGAFKTGARDGWVGWTREQQFRRLHLVANNSRFLVLPGCGVPNLASRVLGLSARGLSAEFEARFGHPVLLAETFVDPSLFGGVCYRAAGWEEAGTTRGFARRSGGWEAHGRPKTVLVKPLSADVRGVTALGEFASRLTQAQLRAVRGLLSELDVAGRAVTLDALHSCPATASLICERGADYLVTVKGNHKTLLDDIRALDWSSAAEASSLGKAHGRVERRRCRAIPLDGVAPADCADLPGRRQAFRVDRRRTVVRRGGTVRESRETAFGLTSLPPGRAGPAELLALNRGHWAIENRLHHVRDTTYDEDRSRARSGVLPRNLACLTNAAISIVRLGGRFAHLPPANRYYAARQHEALREVVRPRPGS